MKPFLYCPSCAARLPERDEHGAATCRNCGRSWYVNAAPTVGAAIVSNGRALLTQRARDPFAGRFDVPGGFLNPDEDPVAALKREVLEELDIEIEVGENDFIQAVPHTYGDGGDWVLAMGFRARLVSGRPAPADDVAAIRWTSADELEEVDCAWDHDRRLVRKALADERART
jgi:ADP-ribose pyrophosphatase YjhB (NUDIX family)